MTKINYRVDKQPEEKIFVYYAQTETETFMCDDIKEAKALKEKGYRVFKKLMSTTIYEFNGIMWEFK